MDCTQAVFDLYSAFNTRRTDISCEVNEKLTWIALGHGGNSMPDVCWPTSGEFVDHLIRTAYCLVASLR